MVTVRADMLLQIMRASSAVCTLFLTFFYFYSNNFGTVAGGRERPHIISRDVGPISAVEGGGGGGAGEREAFEAKLFSMRVETAHAEKV